MTDKVQLQVLDSIWTSSHQAFSNMKGILRDHKRRTAHHIASTRYAVIGRGGGGVYCYPGVTPGQEK